MRILKTCGVMALVAVLSACETQKAPAEAALKAAEDAYGAVAAEAGKYVPDQAKDVQAALSAVKEAVTKGEYANALKDAPALSTRITGLATAVAARKTELAGAWTAVSTSLTPMVAALTSEVEKLGKSRRLPAGVTKAAVDAAKTGVASVTELWTRAMGAAARGDLIAANGLAADVKAKVAAKEADIKSGAFSVAIDDNEPKSS